MTGWQVATPTAAVVLIACGTWVLIRRGYRRQRLVLGFAAVSWAAGVGVLVASLPLPLP